MNTISIGNTSIRQSGNLFNLNDLHRASGSENRHHPTFWLQNQQAIELIKEIELENATVGNPTLPVIQVINGGRNRGTFVCKELVYAYATWISAKFFLQVIRTFDSYVSGSQPIQPSLPLAETATHQEYFAHLAKMAHYAAEFEKIQSMLTNSPYSEETKQFMTSLNWRTTENGAAYLFAFKPNLQNDVKQAFDFLQRFSQMA
ncbi:KilA-N domain-containing protein [Kingella kingae]|uniref:KilA-N domain-containing protein n=2 Tax=Kingella kingae TaxID=504 RepID=UPI0003FDA9A3|nr:KilA-N domain-containing protein [Kingella kingae]MDK4576326.1 KilA-N domain-containing protein [Kingella kingae]MDK4582349.1 KilA-N domain-containing protein [Kingella kingae]MDK4592885.1 KilA-N domain-containing protein [Kingella kingae]MDK4594545.1 KilA-N domain-containing protein [Kingella kingae]MDK4645388.1 KilA-N domain-containing protein [Kingella kingae]